MECTDKIWFGKHESKTLEEIPSKYLAWLFEEFADNKDSRKSDLAEAAEKEYDYRSSNSVHWD